MRIIANVVEITEEELHELGWSSQPNEEGKFTYTSPEGQPHRELALVGVLDWHPVHGAAIHYLEPLTEEDE